MHGAVGCSWSFGVKYPLGSGLALSKVIRVDKISQVDSQAAKHVTNVQDKHRTRLDNNAEMK